MERNELFKTVRRAALIGLAIGLISSAAWLAAPEGAADAILGLAVGIGFAASICLGLQLLRRASE